MNCEQPMLTVEHRRKHEAIFSIGNWTLNVYPVKLLNGKYLRRKVLEAVDLDTIRSIGPSIVQELLFKAHLKGFSITEIPIVFPERDAGESNLNTVKLLQGFWMVLKLRGMHMVGRL